MKKIRILALFALVFMVTPVSADEGMWLLPLLEKMNIKTMQQMGLKLSAEDIYSVNNSSIKDAIVHFGGGCTAEMISSEGLLITNHHCGYGSIQRLSSVENDYLANGYWAMDRSQELPAEGLSVTFLESMTDVTRDVERALRRAKTEQDSTAAMKQLEANLTGKAVGESKYLRARVYSMYGGNAYYLVVSKVYNDVRFVGAPPSSIGKFGADTDNWMWPRHTCDFAMFRVYADKDNNPASYSPDNVPYRPKQHLKISLKGIQPNDFTMIIGYPGRTNRFMTQSELVETRDISNAISIYIRGIRQELMMEDMLADPKVKLQYASKYSGSSNGWKKWMGMNETFAKLDVESRRAKEEVEFKEWVGKKRSRTKKYGNALDKINYAVKERAEALTIYTTLAESVGRIEIMSIASAVNTFYNTVFTTDREQEQYSDMINSRIASFYKNYSEPTDRKITKAMIKIAKERLPEANLPSFYREIERQFSGDVDAYVDYLFDNSIFTSEKSVLDAIAAGTPVKEDPAVMLSNSFSLVIPPLRAKIASYQKTFNEGKKAYIDGTLEMRKGEAIYPDANSTMRLTYGQVLPYSPRDAVVYNYYTTLEGVMQKEDPDNWEFVVPEKLKELYRAKDYGRYAMPNGEMPACFITNSDITGGNSGSPVLNANGELLGLAFDGNWEAMSGDIIFEPELQRCINVDIRYVLFIMDKFGGAGYLLDEMDIVE